MPDPRKVVLVHGVASRGRWYEKVRDILHPHFDCVEVRYWHFIALGLVVLVLWPLAVLAVPVALLVAVWQPPPGIPGWQLLVASLVGAAMVHTSLLWLTNGATGSVRRQIDARYTGNRAPHAIAHSFGTFLSTRVLERSATLTFGRLILVGSVLRSGYSWNLVERKVHAVRNEVGCRDFVAWIAVLAFRLGRAGRDGFHASDLVHWIEEPLGSCTTCCRPAVRHGFLVHNVRLKGYSHSEFSVERRHVSDLWLPALWGLVPEEYVQFCQRCETLAEAVGEKRWRDAERECAGLREANWSWLGGARTLGDRIVEEMKSFSRRFGFAMPAGQELSDDVDRVVEEVGRAVAEAVSERKVPAAERSVELARQLHPIHAVGAAVERVMA